MHLSELSYQKLFCWDFKRRKFANRAMSWKNRELCFLRDKLCQQGVSNIVTGSVLDTDPACPLFSDLTDS
jgi:hypothetical protein